MKRSILMVVAVSMLASVAMAQTNVVSVNVVGYTKTDLPPNAYILRAMPFDDLNQNENTLLSIFGTNKLDAAANPLNGDQVMVWLTGELRYQKYAQYTDRQFYPCNDLTEWADAITAAQPTNPVIPAGTSFWLIRGSLGSTTNQITFLGEVVNTATQNVNLVSGYQMLSYAFSTSVAITNISTVGMTSAANPLNADNVMTWDQDHYQKYGLYTDGKWYPCNDLTEWADAITASSPTTRVIEMGEGFWFISQGAKTWSESNPYLNNL